MSILEILKALSEYGVTLVICAVFFYVIIRLLNLGFDKLGKTVSNKQHDKLLAMRAEIDVEVYDLINNFITSHRGTRIQVMEFTNSVISVAYLPFKYMSCTYEVVAYGGKPEARRIDKLSTSLFSPFLSKLSKKGSLVLDNESAEELSGAVHDIFEGLGSKYQLCAVLRSPKGKSIGFVSFAKELDVTQQDQTDIKTLASQLSALLGVLDT